MSLVRLRPEAPRCRNSGAVCGRSSSGRARPCQGRGSEFEPRRPLQKSPPIRVVIFFRVLLGAHRRVSRLPPAVAARQPGHFLETASLHPPQAALRRFPRRGRVTSPTRSAGPRSKSGAGGQRKRGNTFSQSVFCHCKIQKHMLRLCKQEEGFL